jgi:hypothetical protein
MALDQHQVRVFLLDASNELRDCLLAPLSLLVRCDTFISIKRQKRHKEKGSVSLCVLSQMPRSCGTSSRNRQSRQSEPFTG